jgi:hypothetical protein
MPHSAIALLGAHIKEGIHERRNIKEGKQKYRRNETHIKGGYAGALGALRRAVCHVQHVPIGGALV